MVISARELQIILGHWCHMYNFRRECSAVHTRVWGYLSSWKQGRRWLDEEIAAELVHGLCLLPLFEFDLRAEVDEVITCSDASEQNNSRQSGAARSTPARKHRRLTRSSSRRAAPGSGSHCCGLILNGTK